MEDSKPPRLPQKFAPLQLVFFLLLVIVVLLVVPSPLFNTIVTNY